MEWNECWRYYNQFTYVAENFSSWSGFCVGYLVAALVKEY